MPHWNHLPTLEANFLATYAIPYNIPMHEIKLRKDTENVPFII